MFCIICVCVCVSYIYIKIHTETESTRKKNQKGTRKYMNNNKNVLDTFISYECLFLYVHIYIDIHSFIQENKKVNTHTHIYKTLKVVNFFDTYTYLLYYKTTNRLLLHLHPYTVHSLVTKFVPCISSFIIINLSSSSFEYRQHTIITTINNIPNIVCRLCLCVVFMVCSFLLCLVCTLL